MKCARCGAGVVGRAHWQKIEGWVQKRHGGGSNHVALKEYKPVYLCESCCVLLKSGQPWATADEIGEQTSLACDCGNPAAEGIVHRTGRPCYHDS